MNKQQHTKSGLPDFERMTLAVVGLGYVGLPLAAELARHWPVIGYDTNSARVSRLEAGEDPTGEVSDGRIANSNLAFTRDVNELERCDVVFVAVPTPVNRHNYPDLEPLLHATRAVGQTLTSATVVVYESTVFPGATEEICAPALEEVSGLKLNEDFFVGYSPERINPGDREHSLTNVVRITSGSTPEAAEFIDRIYRRIVPVGTHKAPSIRVAEAAKAIENTQRDVNIALVNELAMMFSRMGLDTQAVLEAAETKWNFLPFKPGLVGGHCIGVDPYYLIHKAQEAGYHPELILAARRINNDMARHVTNQVLRLMALKEISIVGARILVMGIAFKENCADLRNTQVAPIVDELLSFHAEVDVLDPLVDADECEAELNIRPVAEPSGEPYDCLVLAVAHDRFTEMGIEGIRALAAEKSVIYDVKHVLPKEFVDGRL